MDQFTDDELRLIHSAMQNGDPNKWMEAIQNILSKVGAELANRAQKEIKDD